MRGKHQPAGIAEGWAALRRGRDGRQELMAVSCRAVPAAALLLAGLLLAIPIRGGAQGNPAVIVRQMQARMAAMNAMLQQQQTTIQRLNRDRTTSTTQLQQLQAAIDAAAAAGDPLARAARSPVPAMTLQKLTAQLQTRSRSAAAVAAAASTDTGAPDLTGARLRDTVLRGARLPKANLTGADLTDADLSRAVLTGSILRSAKLQGATLTGADLTNADLKDALYDAHTRWPTGFDPAQHAALLVQ